MFGKDKQLLIWVSVGFNSSEQGLLISFAGKTRPFYNDYAHKHVIRNDIFPQKYREFVCSWINAAGSIVSGCCGVSPEQIKTSQTQITFELCELIA